MIAGGSPRLLIAMDVVRNFPDRVARNRGNGSFVLANGRGAAVEQTSSLVRAPYIAVGELTGTAASGRILLAIEDDGPGISPADRERLFQPFFRGSEGLRDSSGSGLGLLLSRQIVEAHGGHLRVVAAASGGARVEVELVR